MQHHTLPIISSKLFLNSCPYFTSHETTTHRIPLGVQHIGRVVMKCYLEKSSLDTDTVQTYCWNVNGLYTSKAIISGAFLKTQLPKYTISCPDLCCWHKHWSNTTTFFLNPLNAELNPICHLLALVGAHHILHISRVRVK